MSPAHDPAYWRKIYAQDPELLLRKGTKVPPDAYLEYVIGKHGLVGKENFQKFEGSNGCVAWAWSRDGEPVKKEEDSLGQPVIKASVVVSWNPTIRSYKGGYYDFLAYEREYPRGPPKK